MADWRQIQARIRKAKTSADPLMKLSELYQRTRDAMVAWELGTVEEKNGRNEQAAKWYTAAAQRFRRAEWKKKAEEALARLGIEISPESAQTTPSSSEPGGSAEVASEQGSQFDFDAASPFADSETSGSREPERAFTPPERTPLADDEIVASDLSAAPSSPDDADNVGNTARPEGHKKRRRGRRGGRGRHRKPTAVSPSLPAHAFTPPPPSQERPAHTFDRPSRPLSGQSSSRGISSQPEGELPERRREDRSRFETDDAPTSIRAEQAAPQVPSERITRGRAGDPALASRMAHLESMLRRLLSAPLHRLDELEDAPAGPGVFLLSDSDQVTSYYVEACQTLRIGLGNLGRGSHGGKGRRPAGRGYSESSDLKEKLADHLGINQSKVSQYMKDHCVVRWIQLDDDAPHLAHFAVAVLRAPLNLD